jgi:hypothetical protein
VGAGDGDNETPLLASFLYLFGEGGHSRRQPLRRVLVELTEETGSREPGLPPDLNRKQCQAGSLTGAVHLSKGNVGVLRLAQ